MNIPEVPFWKRFMRFPIAVALTGIAIYYLEGKEKLVAFLKDPLGEGRRMDRNMRVIWKKPIDDDSDTPRT